MYPELSWKSSRELLDNQQIYSVEEALRQLIEGLGQFRDGELPEKEPGEKQFLELYRWVFSFWRIWERDRKAFECGILRV